jgi:hypothetical protein
MHLVATAVCIAALWGVIAQRRQLENLRAEKQRQLERLSAPAKTAVPGPADTGDAAQAPTPGSPSPELLRLRNEVSQLMAKQRGLAGVSNESHQLEALAAARATNTGAPLTLPPGYILRSQAQWSGFNTPDNTVQSFLWAAQNRDLTNLLQALTPEFAQQVMGQFQQKGGAASNEFFQGLSHFPGMRVVERQPQPDGSIELKVEIVPGMPEQPIHVRFLNGQWKLDLR